MLEFSTKSEVGERGRQGVNSLVKSSTKNEVFERIGERVYWQLNELPKVRWVRGGRDFTLLLK